MMISALWPRYFVYLHLASQYVFQDSFLLMLDSDRLVKKKGFLSTEKVEGLDFEIDIGVCTKCILNK